MTTTETLARVRLRPKADAKRLRHGFPWVYDDEVVTDRRTRALTPGSLAVLEDGARSPLALVTVNPGSKIICRVMDTDPAAQIGAAWLRVRIARAAALRTWLYAAPFCRLVHAEADGLPGLVIDRFGDAAVIQPNAAWAEAWLGDITDALRAETGVTRIVKNAGGRARKLEGLDDQTRVIAGALDGPVEVPMNGARYLADLTGGQKTGLYYDQRDNHAFAARLAGGADCLDVFAHVGGFGLAMLAGGAARVLAVDGSAPALALAEAGAVRGGVDARLATRQGDAFEVMTALGQEGARHDVVVCDPPAFAPNKAALEAGLRAYERTARLSAGLVAEGGYLVLCSCSHAVGLERFRAACIRGTGRAGRAGQLIHTGFAAPDHPQHPQLAETGYLKALFFRLT